MLRLSSEDHFAALLLDVKLLLTIAIPRFLCDSMLGRLCRWLRAMGQGERSVGMHAV
jgi:hypothetical protein